MTAAYRSAQVFVRGKYAGILKQTETGYSFSYDKQYLSDPSSSCVSLTLPMREEEYTSTTLFPFFDGLIPEGWLLNVVTKNWKLDPKDRFGILLVACRDCIGNVSVVEDTL